MTYILMRARETHAHVRNVLFTCGLCRTLETPVAKVGRHRHRAILIVNEVDVVKVRQARHPLTSTSP